MKKQYEANTVPNKGGKKMKKCNKADPILENKMVDEILSRRNDSPDNFVSWDDISSEYENE